MEHMFNKDFYSAPIESLGDKFAFGGVMLLIGMLTVFSVLAILFICLTLFKYAFTRINNAQSKSDAGEPAAVIEQPVAPVSNTEEEIVAVIAAAIAMAESEATGIKFRVVSFKRK